MSTDFYPTILDIAGMPLLPDQHHDGVGIVPLLKGTGRLSRDAFFRHYPHYGNQGGSPGSAVRSGDFKLIAFFEDGRMELYNLEEDIGETRNLAEAMPDKVNQLSARLREWRRLVGAGMPTPNPDYQE